MYVCIYSHTHTGTHTIQARKGIDKRRFRRRRSSAAVRTAAAKGERTKGPVSCALCYVNTAKHVHVHTMYVCMCMC